MKKIILATTLFAGIFSMNAQNTHTNTGDNSGTGILTDQSSFFGVEAGQYSTGINNVFSGYQAGKNNTASEGVFIGVLAGNNNTGTRNTLIGNRAGMNNTSGNKNVAIGWASSSANSTGYGNTAIGDMSARRNTTGSDNTNIGRQAGFENTTGVYNVSLGSYAGTNNSNGSNNTFLGGAAGYNSLGSGHVFIGFTAGREEQGDNKLYIENSNSSTPLIYGDFSTDEVAINGKLAIGTMTLDADSALTVNGKILCEEVEVIQDVAPDYVFQKYYLGESTLKEDYTMPTLEEVEAFTKANHHLPEVPSAEEIKEEGMGLKQMSTLLLQKVEELTLYTIEQEKRINALEAKLAEKE